MFHAFQIWIWVFSLIAEARGFAAHWVGGWMVLRPTPNMMPKKKSMPMLGIEHGRRVNLQAFIRAKHINLISVSDYTFVEGIFRRGVC
jgi:hypothetical protein